MPEVVQTEGVVLAKLTGRPDVAVALTENGASPYVWFASGPKLMV